MKAIEDEKNYLKTKGMFFRLAFSDNLILVKVIESVEEMETEGRLMHHCVGGYHNRKNSPDTLRTDRRQAHRNGGGVTENL